MMYLNFQLRKWWLKIVNVKTCAERSFSKILCPKTSMLTMLVFLHKMPARSWQGFRNNWKAIKIGDPALRATATDNSLKIVTPCPQINMNIKYQENWETQGIEDLKMNIKCKLQPIFMVGQYKPRISWETRPRYMQAPAISRIKTKVVRMNRRPPAPSSC